MASSGGEKHVYMYYRVIRVAKTAALRRVIRIRDICEKEIDNKSVSVRITGKTRRKITLLEEGLSD